MWWPLSFPAFPRPQFSSVDEAISVVSQVAGALAVGETVSDNHLLPTQNFSLCQQYLTHFSTLLLQALEMEHRDLHLSNILVRQTKQTLFTFRLNNTEEMSVTSHGVKATVVDYTLSRVKQGIYIFPVDAVQCFTHCRQWNLRTRDTLGLIVLSLVERLSLSRR